MCSWTDHASYTGCSVETSKLVKPSDCVVCAVDPIKLVMHFLWLKLLKQYNHRLTTTSSNKVQCAICAV